MEVINKEGKDIDLIINEISEENNVTKEDILYRYEEIKTGLLKKNISYKVSAILKKDLIDYVKEYLSELLTNMGLTSNFESKLREDTIYIKIYSSNNPVLIGRDGKTLKSLENIVKQKINTDFGIRTYINLDIENYREKKQHRLERLAKNLARDVSKTKQEIHMDNMSAYERIIVHNILTNFKGIKTESEGEEPNRHIVIKPE